jgi:hypothetical protein
VKQVEVGACYRMPRIRQDSIPLMDGQLAAIVFLVSLWTPISASAASMPSPVSPVLGLDADVGTSRLCARRDEMKNYLLRWNFQQDKITSFKDGGLLVRYSGQGNMLWVVHWPNGTSCIYGRGTIDPPPDPGT